MTNIEMTKALAKHVNDCGFPASAVRSIINDFLREVRLPDDEKLYLLASVADSMTKKRASR